MKRKAKYREPLKPATFDGMTFWPGDEVIMYAPGTDGHARRAWVLTEYNLQGYTDDGETPRLAYGYLIRVDGETDATFAFAWQVRRVLDKPAHIRKAK